MRPAQAMGTFLKVWRSEWAGLSRAQLAIAVSAWLTNGKRVKPGVVRWWEDGQPPGSTEELEALLQVMRTHGLTFPEVSQFRTAVFAACLDRQYPGLNCDDCREAQAIDGIIPDCETDEGCKVPSLSVAAMRALEIRDRLSRLSRLGVGGKILDLYEATIDDLELIAVIEDHASPQPQQGADDEGR